MKFLLSLFIASSLWAGQSLQLGFNGTEAINTAFPARCNADWRIESYIHDFPSVPTVRILGTSALNLDVTFSSNTLRFSSGLTGAGTDSQSDLSITKRPSSRLYWRFQFTLSSFTTSVEVWDESGVRLDYKTVSGTGYSGCAPGITVGNYQNADPQTKTAFFAGTLNNSSVE